MSNELKYLYRFEYLTLFGHEFTEFVATDDDEASRIFWATRNPELNRLHLISRSPCNEEGDDGADCGDEDRPSDLPESAEKHFSQEVFSGRSEFESFPVPDDKLFTSHAECYAGRRRMRKRIEDFFAVHFRKHH